LRRAVKRSDYQAWNVIFMTRRIPPNMNPHWSWFSAGSVLTRDGLLVVEHFHKHAVADKFGRSAERACSSKAIRA